MAHSILYSNGSVAYKCM